MGSENQVTAEVVTTNDGQQTIVLTMNSNNSVAIDAAQKEVGKLVAGAGFINAGKEQAAAPDIVGAQSPNAGTGTVLKDELNHGIT